MNLRTTLKKNALWLFLMGVCITLGLRAAETTSPPENMDFSELSDSNPVEEFSVSGEEFKGALATNWKVVTLNTLPSVKWIASYKGDYFSISPSAFTAKAPYCSYLVSPALDLPKIGNKVLSFAMVATASSGVAPLKVLLINSKGETIKELLSEDQKSSSSSSYFPKEVQIPSSLEGVGFIAFVATGDKTNRTQFKLRDLKLSAASTETEVSCNPKEGLYFDTTEAGGVGATKEVEVFIKNFSGVPGVSLAGPNAEDFRLINKNALTQTGGKLQIVFEPKSGGDKTAQVQVQAGKVLFSIALSGKATGAVAQIKMKATPTSLSFGKMEVGKKSVQKSVAIEIQNAVSAPVVTVKGSNASEFSVTNGEKLTAQGGGLVVVFEPSSVGSKTASIELKSGDTLLEIALEGQGVQPGVAPDPEEPKDDVELLIDQYFYHFNTSDQPVDWAFEGNVSKLERGYNSSTGFAVSIDARNSTQGGALMQTVTLAGDKVKVKAGDVLEGMFHFRSMEPKVEGGAVRLACRWLDAAGKEIAGEEDAFINSSEYFDRHKAWDEVRFRTTAPVGATQFLFKVMTRAGSVVELDDFSLLRLTSINAAREFVSVLPHISTLTGEKGKSVTGKLLIQAMKLPYSYKPTSKAANGTMSIAPEQLPAGNSIGTYTVTITPNKKGVFYNGYVLQFMGENPISTAAFNTFFIDPANPPKAELASQTQIREMECYPGETDVQTLTFDINGVIESPKVVVEQEESGIFMLNTSSFYYSAPSDKVINNSVKVTFRPKADKEYSAKIIVSSALMEPLVVHIKGRGKKNTDGWIETFSADKPLDSRFTGEAWEGYHLFDRGYYRLDGSWKSSGAVSVNAGGSIECDEWFANGIDKVAITPSSLTGKLQLEYSLDGGGHWTKVKAWNADGSAAINTHRPTRFRLINSGSEVVELNKITLSPADPKLRLNFLDLTKEVMQTAADATPLALLNETFNTTRHTRGINLPGWQTLVLQADRPFWGWAQKNKATMVVEEQCAQISFLNSLNKDDKRPHQAWLISPTLSYQKAASKILTFRLRYELPTEDGREKFGVYIIKEKEGEIEPLFLDITKLLLVDNVESETWYDYYVDLSKVEGISIEDLFHVGFSFFSPVGGNATSLTFMIDDVTFGRTDMTEISVDKDLISFLFKVDQECPPQVFKVTTKNPKNPIALTMVPSRLAEQFKLSATQLPKEGGEVAVGFKSKDEKKRAAALLLQSRGSASKLVRLMAQFDNAIEMPEAIASSRVYPTTVSQTLNVQGIYTEFFIFSLDGELMQQGKASHKIDVEHLPAGGYIIRLLTEDGGISTHRFVRQ